MARSLSSTARAAIFAQQTGEVFVVLLALEHPDFSATLRVCSNDTAVTSGGYEYLPFPFDITLPDDIEDAPPRVALRIDNVDRRVVQEIRGIRGNPVTVRLSVVIASNPDAVEAGPFEFALRDVQYDSKTVEGTLMYEDILSESFPADSFTPARFPGLF